MKCRDCEHWGWGDDEGTPVWGWCWIRTSCPDPDIGRSCPDFLPKAPDISTALSTLQAENEKLRETVDKYATAARAIALHLKPFCDESLPYDEMIADAARKASDEMERVKRENSHLKERLYGMEKD